MKQYMVQDFISAVLKQHQKETTRDNSEKKTTEVIQELVSLFTTDIAPETPEVAAAAPAMKARNRALHLAVRASGADGATEGALDACHKCILHLCSELGANPMAEDPRHPTAAHVLARSVTGPRIKLWGEHTHCLHDVQSQADERLQLDTLES